MFVSTLFAAIAYAGEKKNGSVSVMSKGEPIYTCPGDDFVLQGKMCTRVNTHKFVPVCEDGLLRDGVCEVSIAPREVCPNGFSFDGNVCLSWEEFNPVVNCPQGYNIVGSKKDAYCEKNILVPGPMVCPQGTVNQGKKCVSWSHVQPIWECQAGTVMDGAYCLSYEEYDCSPNAVPMSKKGGKHLRMLGEKDHMVVGSKGYVSETVSKVSMMCKRTNYDARVMTCPPNTFVDGKECKIENYFEMIQEKGIMTQDTAPINSYCPQGDYCNHKKDKHGETCCVYNQKAPFLECGPGYELIGNRCLAYRKPIAICKDGKKKNKKGQCTSLEYREPIVTFKASYSCVGKDCGGHKH